MALVEDLQLLAFEAVVLDTGEYRLRQICRWYSRHFHVPLPQVANISLADLLTAFWESHYEDMSPEDLEDERIRLTETEDEKMQRLLAEDKERAENEIFVAETEAIAKAQEQAKKTGNPLVTVPNAAVKTRMKIPESNLPTISLPEKLPENVSIKFTDSNFFEDMIERLDGIEVPKADGDKQSSK